MRAIFSAILPTTLLVFVWATFSPALAFEVKKVTARNGIEAWLVEDHTNPIIAVRMAFRGGASLDPKGKEGLAHMVSTTLNEGAGDLDSQAFQGRLQDLAISLFFDTGYDAFFATLKTLTANSAEAFNLLRLALTKPRFDTAPVERMRSEILASLKQDMENPASTARHKMAAIMFPDHPYGRPVEGTLDSIGAITADDLKNFAAKRLALDNMVIGVVGDITPKDLARLLEDTFLALPAKASSWQIAEVSPKAIGRTVVVHMPVPQSAIVFAHQGIKRNNPDFYVAYVVNHILGGGGFTSRLYGEVREKRGLAYSIYSRLYPFDKAALVFGSAGTANASVAKTISLVRAEWRKMATDGISKAELDDAKTYLTGSFALRFSSSRRIASILAGMQLENLGIDYLDKRNSYIKAVTLKDVNRMAKTLLKPDALSFVVAGDPQGME